MNHAFAPGTWTRQLLPGLQRVCHSARQASCSETQPCIAGVRAFVRRAPGRLRRAALLALGLALLACIPTAASRADDVPAPVLQAEQQRIQAIDKAVKTAVAVFATDGNGGGSGVVITPDGYALSNYHVTSPVGDYLQCGMADGRLYDAVIVGIDPTGDVALIKLLGRDDFPHAELADSDQVRVGDWCFAVGNPFLLATDFKPTVTFGLVSGVHRYQYPAGTLLEYADCIQTDAAINPGNSGGPLFNAQGQLIGINGRGSFEKRGRVNVGLGYAISINQIKNFLGYLRSGRIVDHATLGATVVSDDRGRVVVSNILTSSDAYRRGLRYNDQLVAFGGREIGSVNAFKNVLGIYPRGWRVPLSYLRDGERYDVLVRLAGVHGRGQLIEMVQKSQAEVPDPAPRPGQPRRGRPDGDPPEDPPGENPPGGDPPPDFPKEEPHSQGPVQVPDEIAALIESRPGYANFYFNAQNRERVWEAFARGGEFQSAHGPWLLTGRTADGERVAFQLDDEMSTLDYGSRRSLVTTGKDLSEQLEPAGSGGLLAALHCWRKLLSTGPDAFGNVYYVGTRPVAGREGLFDVLAATHDVVELDLSFDPASGELVLLEMFPDFAVDSCEVRFDDYRDVAGRRMPHRMTVLFDDAVFAVIQLEEIQLSPASAAPANEEA